MRAVSLLIKDLSIQYLSALIIIVVFVVSLSLVNFKNPLAYWELYPNNQKKTLYLNRFRRKPAISEFD